ncbi:LptF/LptG family permease [Deinococcus soli (ex Cha et al. 2016)]|uniref:Lipopolysaccharide export system permease protein n=2 Tax=Deinococcus soli (ex Cha et al. 2016) TaxID=1309411 RepID=A0AAE3XBU6_9DEIO|nr:LptF/LptG family permease [Deinococcus soli (ex Cha et al. 2016)]MDR6217592.1 lipopolysaccharide export system permease protein [Deinococcus soli (ex Cha et al. 2016)]MDR6326901.1 lipopolysaccharide export system permease protein [Deinococcus soli (ex Cha et al. 2016)]MDR6750373.1 lipopolysaccharide export system permease protein [Deinococcus soli (ex Cha et al. 2016)]
MTRLTRYVTLELLPPLLAGTLLFTAILSFGYFFISSQWLQGVPVALVGQWIAYQVPDTLVKVLPMAVVLMTVVAFGRMSTERELVAVQSGGISLGRVARPAGVVALLVTALSVWLSLWVAPRLNVETRGLYWDVLTGAGLSQLSGKTVDLGDGVTLFMRGYDATTRELQGVRLERWESGNTRLGTLTFADRATFENRVLTLRGYRVFRVDFGAAARLPGAAQNPLTLPGTVAQTFPAIRSGGTLRVDTGLSRTETLATYADAVGADAQGWPELMASLTKPGVKAAERDAARVTLNRKLALPFANLVLALAALPFALRYGRTLGVALGLALLLAVAYYLLFFMGLTLAPLLPGQPEAGVWLANVVFAALGLTLLRRA